MPEWVEVLQVVYFTLLITTNDAGKCNKPFVKASWLYEDMPPPSLNDHMQYITIIAMRQAVMWKPFVIGSRWS